MTLKAVVTFDTVTGEEADKITNTFALPGTVTAGDIGTTEEAAINLAFERFYSVAPTGGTLAIAKYLSPVLVDDVNAGRLDLYDITGHLDGTPAGSPFSSTLFDLAGPASADGLPNETAFVVTLEGTGRDTAPVEAPDGSDSGVALDRPKQRRTGRIYLGPLGINASTGGTGVVRPTTAFMTDARLATVQLHTELDAVLVGLLGLGVWSRKDGFVYPLEAVSTDNAFDTQRRRGQAATARTRLAV